MADIKTKDSKPKTIKTLNKAVVGTQNIKDNIVSTKEKINENTPNKNDENNIEYGSNTITGASSITASTVATKFNKYGKKSFEETKENIIKSKVKIKDFKNKQLAKKMEKQAVKTGKGTIKTSKNTIKNGKTAVKTSKEVAIKSQRMAKESVKASKRAIQTAKETAKATARGIKLAIKATISAIKGIIAGTKALIAAIVAGGWVAVVVILVVCLVALLCGSIFGIFFSSEDTGTITMSSVVKEINTEMSDKIQKIQDDNPHDDFKIESDRAEWKDVLSIYSAKISKGTNETDLITLDDNKKQELKTIFWVMNDVSYEIKEEATNYEESDSASEETHKVLYIKITSKSIEEMENQYGFSKLQKDQVDELLKDDYKMMWSSVIFGTPVGSLDIVQIALSQVGNVGGQPYWSWYGFNSRVEWCAVFVSWVANEAGYLQAGVIPKFSGCENGINWFKAMGQWQEKGYVPRAGDIIFFDWEVDGQVNHVGIVEKVENNKVYTVEGNSTDDTCRQKEYSINSKYIFGYGTPAY